MKIVPYILIVSTLFFGCKKYPEDEISLHLRTPEQRLKHFSPWYLAEYTVDGFDSMPQLNSKYFWMAPIANQPYHMKGGYVVFDKAKSKIRLDTHPVFMQSFFPENWEIVQLDKEAFKLRILHNNKVYTYKLINKK